MGRHDHEIHHLDERLFMYERTQSQILRVLERLDNKMQQLVNKQDFLTLNIQTMGQKTDQALADIALIKGTLDKVSAETSTLLQKITDLENTAGNNDTPQEVLDAIAAVKTQAEAVDALVPDAPPSEELHP